MSTDWQEAFDENGNIYYYNMNTNETSWELPKEQNAMPSRRKSQLAMIQETIAAQISESPWIEKFSEKHQRKYWKHKDTGETTWKEPILEIEVTQALNIENLEAKAIKESPWIEKYSEKHQRKYWKNKDTGKTTWNEADIFEMGLQQEKQQEEKQQEEEQQQVTGQDNEWEEKFSEKHQKKYWKNKTTGKTTWNQSDTIIEINQQVNQHIVQESEWEEKYSEKHKKKYWKNKTTGKTTWSDPITNEESFSLVSISAKKNNNNESLQVFKCFAWYFYGLEQIIMIESNRILAEFGSSSISISFPQESGRRPIKIELTNIAKVTLNKISWSIILSEYPSKNGQSPTHCLKTTSSEEIELMSNMLSRRLLGVNNNKVEMIDKSSGILLFPKEACSLSRSYCMRKLSSKILESEYSTLYSHHQTLLNFISEENASTDKFLLQKSLDDIDKQEYQDPVDFLQNKNISMSGIVVAKIVVDLEEQISSYNPYWIKVDRTTKTISFHIHGQGSVPYFVIDTSDAVLTFTDIREKENDLSIKILNGKIKNQSDEVEIILLFHTTIELWKWTIVIGSISSEIITFDESKIAFNPSNNTIFNSKNIAKKVLWNQDILDASLSIISMIADRHIVQNLFRCASVSGSNFATTKFSRINDNLVLITKGSSDLIEGSVLLAVNGLSMIVDSHHVVRFFPDLPKQHPVEVKLFKFPQSDYQVQVCVVQQDSNISSLVWQECSALFIQSHFVVNLGSTEVLRIKLSACQIRLVSLKNGVLDLALEAQDADNHVLVTASYIRSFLSMVEIFVQGMKLLGSLKADFNELCGKAERLDTSDDGKNKLIISPGKSGENSPYSPSKEAYDNNTMILNDETDTEVDYVHSMLVAAEELENTISSLNIPLVFPSPTTVAEQLRNLAKANRENHENLAHLISMEKINNNEDENASLLSFDEIENCSQLIFYLRDHPKELVTLSKSMNYESNSILAGIIVNRICNSWSSDMISLRRFLECAISLDNNVSHRDFSISLLEHKTFLNALINEIGLSVEIVSFIEYICSTAIDLETITAESRIGDLCSLVVEPLCQRLDSAAKSGMIPMLLVQTTAALSKVKGRLSAEDIFTEVLIPRIVNRAFNSDRVKSNPMIVSRVVNLLCKCFGRNHKSSIVLSLSDTAALSRSKWLVNRFLDALYSLHDSSVNEPSPVASISGIKSGECKPHCMTDIICVHTSELHFILQSLHSLTDSATFELLHLPRSISSAFVAILNSDVIERLGSVQVTSQLQSLLLVNDQKHYEAIENKYIETNAPGNSELASYQWLINAARSTLKLVYEVEDWSNKNLIQKYRASLRELSLLRDQLIKRHASIRACIKDFQILEIYGNVLHGYRYQIEICKENLMNVSKDKNINELSNALLQAYHNQMAIESQIRELREVQNKLNLNTSPSKKVSSPSKNSNDINSELKSIVVENPLMLVMHLFSK